MLFLKAYLALHHPKIRQYAGITLGCLFSAWGINMLLTPNSLLADGAVGIAGIFYLTLGLPVSVSLFLMNVPLFYFFRNYLPGAYLRISIVSFVIYTVLLESTTSFFAAWNPTQDLFLASIFGGVLNGLGCGLVFRSNACTGGVDLIGVVVKKRYGMDVGTVCFIANAVLVLIALFVLNPEVALYTLVSMYVTGLLTDRTIEGIDTTKVLLIVSKRYQKISDAIIQDSNRSTTLLQGEGGFSSHDTKIVMAVVPMSQVQEVRGIIRRIDKGAFVLILDAAYTNGALFRKKQASRFRLIRRYLEKKKGSPS